MSTPIIVPQLGNEITEAEVTEWLKAPGDAIAEGEPVVMITTTKMAMELEASVAGVMGAISLEEGEIAEVGVTLGLIEPA